MTGSGTRLRLFLPLLLVAAAAVLAIVLIGDQKSGNGDKAGTSEAGHDRKKPSIELPTGTLDRSEVLVLFNDRTVESRTIKKRRYSVTYYHPDGEVRQLRDGNTRHGRWRISKNARICLQMEALREKCRIVVREPDGSYRKYIVKKDGNHQPTVDYVRFWPGNQYSLAPAP
jgi:hypothetical protein